MSTTVKMNLTISGTVNGKPWPEAGAHVSVDDDEAERLIAAGQASVPEDEAGEVVDLTSPSYKAEVEADGSAKSAASKSK